VLRSYSNTAPRENKTSWVSDLEINTHKPERKASFVSEIAAHTRMVRLIDETLGHSRNTSGTLHFLQIVTNKACCTNILSY
jgi:hypothetical protein